MIERRWEAAPRVRIIQSWPGQGETIRLRAESRFAAETLESSTFTDRPYFGFVGGLVIPIGGKMTIESIDCAPEVEA